VDVGEHREAQANYSMRSSSLRIFVGWRSRASVRVSI
jgi:hypothetical protein